MSDKLFDLMKVRRSYYSISKASPISDAQLQTIVETAVTHVPTPFNMQAARAVLLTGKASERLWEIVKTTYAKILGDDKEAIKASDTRIDTDFKSGYGTILFFEDTAVYEAFGAKLGPLMASVFPTWSENSTGILQFSVWTALSNEGLGCSLQHFGAYSPETQSEVLKAFNLPSTWKSTAMMPFGIPTGPPGRAERGPKTFNPIEDRVKVITE